MIEIGQSRVFFCAVLLAASSALAGCGASPPVIVTPRHIEQHGTALFQEPQDTVFRACLVAAQMSGHIIAVAERSMGLIVTSPETRDPFVKPRHGYVIEVRPSPDGRTSVMATPTFGHREDVVQKGIRGPRWELDGERASWARLFEDIRGLLRRGRDETP